MGFFDSIVDTVSGFVKKVPFVGDVVSSALGLATDYGANKLIGVPNLQLQNEFSAEQLSKQFEFNAAEAAKQRVAAAAESALAFERSMDLYKNRYQLTMADMKAAGLNPILAAGSGGFNVGSGLTSPSAGMQMASGSVLGSQSMASPYGAGGSSAQSLASAGKMQEEKEVVKKEVKKKMVETMESFTRSIKNLNESDKLRAEVENLQRQYWEIGARIAQLTSQESLNEAQKAKVEAEIRQLGVVYESLQAKLPEIRARGDVYSTRYFGQGLVGIKEIIDSFLGWFSGVVKD